MALTRRTCLKLFPFCAGAVAACGGGLQRARSLTEPIELARVGDGGTRGTILVFMPETTQTQEVWTGLSDELKKDFALVAVRIDTAQDAWIIARAIASHKPVAIVLMNNPTVAAYREYQRSAGVTHFPPAAVVMTSFFDDIRKQIVNAAGISYEVPLITVVTNLRKLSEKPIDRVGVVRRAKLSGFVRRQADLAAREQITVVEEQLSSSPNASEIKRALRLVKRHIDALWVLNDDRLLSPTLVADGWLPGLNERPRIPVMVGAASLVSAKSSFGTFAVLPDHTALGAQTADLIYDIADNQWQVPDDEQSLLPLSVTTILDVTQARERLSLRADASKQVDRLLE